MDMRYRLQKMHPSKYSGYSLPNRFIFFFQTTKYNMKKFFYYFLEWRLSLSFDCKGKVYDFSFHAPVYTTSSLQRGSTRGRGLEKRPHLRLGCSAQNSKNCCSLLVGTSRRSSFSLRFRKLCWLGCFSGDIT